VEFELSEEQIALQEMASDFLENRWSPDNVRGALDHGPAVIDDEVWKEIIEMGWLGVSAPEEVGGIGGDVLTAAVLAEQAAHRLLPGPFLSSVVAAIALDRSGDDKQTALLADLIAGRKRVTLAVEEATGSWGPDNVAAEAKADGNGYDLTGTKILVPDAKAADELLVAARTDHGVALLRVPASVDGVTIESMRRLDAQAIAEVKLEGVRLPADALVGGPERAADALRESYEIWTTLLAADLLGSAEASLQMTTAFARERVQFDRPIGTFQAVSHRLADNKVELEIARSLLYGACLALDEGRDNAASLVSAAKAAAGDAAVHSAESALHLHGGVGFTWEYDVHLHLRRARSNAASLGDADFHRDRIACLLIEEHEASTKSGS